MSVLIPRAIAQAADEMFSHSSVRRLRRALRGLRARFLAAGFRAALAPFVEEVEEAGHDLGRGAPATRGQRHQVGDLARGEAQRDLFAGLGAGRGEQQRMACGGQFHVGPARRGRAPANETPRQKIPHG